MYGQPRTCNKCGHRCHCYQPDCDECINDVCISWECDRIEEKEIIDLPNSFYRSPV